MGLKFCAVWFKGVVSRFCVASPIVLQRGELPTKNKTRTRQENFNWQTHPNTMMSNEPPDASTPSPRSKRQARKKKLLAAAKNVKTVAGKVGQQLQKVNMAKWIDDLEHDQEVADRMDRINANNREDQKHRDMRREAEEACFNAIQSHFDDFLQSHPTATYENWIEDLHPDNVLEKGGKKVIDHRFYVDDSDHRHLWNRHLRDRERNITRRYVPAKSLLSPEGSFSSTDGIPTNGGSSDCTS